MKHHHETPSFIHIHHLFIIISYYIHNSLSPLYNHHIHYIHYIYHCISMFERKSTNPKTAQPGAIGAEGSRRWRELTSRRGGKIWGTYRQYCGEYRGQYRKIWKSYMPGIYLQILSAEMVCRLVWNQAIEPGFKHQIWGIRWVTNHDLDGGFRISIYVEP